MKQHVDLSRDQQIECIKKYQENGDYESRSLLVRSTLKWLYHVALQYKNKFPNLEVEDFISEGVKGLLKAIDKFDTSRTNTFLTYAHHWVSQSIKAYISKNIAPVKIPLHLTEVMSKIGREMQQIPYDVDITDKEKVISLSDMIMSTKNVSRTYLKRVIQLGDPYYIIDSSYLDDEDLIYDESPTEEIFITSINNVDLREYLTTVIEENLDEKEASVIYDRFGWNDGESKTLKEIGEKLELSNERIRQIQEKALDKLRLALSNNKLNSFK